jgi:hypothetical protein
MNQPEWVVIRSPAYVHEALFIKSLLESVGITAIVPDEHTLNVQPLYSPALGGVRVLVPAAQAERAEEVLSSPRESDDAHRD